MFTKFYQKFIAVPHPYIVLAILIGSLFLIFSSLIKAQSKPLGSENIFRAEVIKVISEQEKESGITGRGSVKEQELLAEVDFGDRKENRTVINDFVPVKKGDKIFTQVPLFSQQEPDEAVYVVDIFRSNGLIWLAALFAVLVWAVGGKKGLYSLVGLIFSFVVIFRFIIPQILARANPVSTGIWGAILILVVAIYVSYGFNRKSFSALLGIIITLVFVGLLADLAIGSLHFSGFGGEESVYLNSQTSGALNLVGILIAGIIIAALGVLDDIAVTQASAVFGLASVSKELRGLNLIKKAMEVGKDHISAVINTLVLAYAGAALPLLLLLTVNDFPVGFVINGEIIAEEIVRTLVSTSSLVLAVPITTVIAAFFIPKNISEYH